MSRDRTVGDTFFIAFTTRSFSTGAPTTLAGTPVISAYEDAGLTQITAGLTLGVDHDAVTGLNMITIVATGGNGFETGKDYQLVITTGTVGGVSVIGEVVGEFSLDLSAALKAVDLLNDVAATDIVSAGAITTSSGAVSSVTTVTTTTTNTDMRGTDSAATAASLATVDSNVDAILVDTGTTIPAQITALNDIAATDIVSAGAITTLSGAVVNVGLVDTCTTNTDQRGTDSALLSADINLTAGAVDNVTLVATTTTNTDMRGTDGANTITPPTAAAITDAVWDELQSGHTTAGTFGKFLDVEVSSVSGGGGLTQQNVRDAMKLTPTAGSPSSGSVDEHLDDILTDTGTSIPGQITGLNDVAATDIVSSGAITTLAGAIANVDLVDTCTANTDMRGTDSANTVVPDNTSIAAILVDTSTTLPALIDDLAIKKNTVFNNFEFLMVLTSDGRTPATGLTVTGQRSVDGGSFTSVGGTIAEVSNGIYQFDALAADTNGDVITWRFLSATADDTFVTFKTVA